MKLLDKNPNDMTEIDKKKNDPSKPGEKPRTHQKTDGKICKDTQKD